MDKDNKRKTILVIEDDESQLSALEQYLEKAGYQIISAINGMEGLKLLDSADYDLVITDINMPYVSGIGVISALKERQPNIPAVAVTGNGSVPLEVAKEKKANVILDKPLEMAALIRHIEKLLHMNTPTQL
jgi:DNA-binding NtrC family response regulator